MRGKNYCYCAKIEKERKELETLWAEQSCIEKEIELMQSNDRRLCA